MELIYFAAGIALAYGIARYNESNKLFWQLALLFILGYAGVVLCTRAFDNNERNSEDSTQVCTTQMQTIAQAYADLFALAGSNMSTPKKVTALQSVVQFVPESNESDVIPSEVYGRTRDQPLKYFDTS